MNYKLQGAIRRSKKFFILYLILWLILAIVFVMPVAYCTELASANGAFNLSIFLENIAGSVTSLGQTISKFATYVGTYFSILWKITLVYIICIMIGLFKSAPKNEFTDIEHGSSDWSKNGEQYRILSNKKGIILAQENYLPLDKRGNVNVLVVGRIRIW